MSVFDLSKIPPMNWTGVLCRECGQRKPRWRMADGWCDTCRGVEPAQRTPAPPCPPDMPREWRVVTTYSRRPGIACVPLTLAEALVCAKRWGGEVVPWDYQPGEAYDHPGKRGSMKPAKYGSELQNGREDAK